MVTSSIPNRKSSATDFDVHSHQVPKGLLLLLQMGFAHSEEVLETRRSGRLRREQLSSVGPYLLVVLRRVQPSKEVYD